MKIIYPDTPKKNENENTFNKLNKRQLGKYSGLKSSPQGNTNKSKESIDNSNTHTLQSGSNISNGHSFTFSDVVLKKTQPVTPRLEKARQLISEFKLNEDSFEQITEGKEDDNNKTNASENIVMLLTQSIEKKRTLIKNWAEFW